MTAQYCAPYAAHGALNWLIRAMTLVIDKERHQRAFSPIGLGQHQETRDAACLTVDNVMHKVIIN